MFKRIIKGFMAFFMVFSVVGCKKEEKEQLSREELATLYQEVALETWDSFGYGDPTIAPVSLLANVVDKKGETTDEGQIDNIKVNANSMAGLIYMVSLLYANENFIISNDIAVFDASILMGQDTFDQSYVLKTSIDKKNNKVYLEALVEVMGSKQYSNVVINYDFENKELVSFRFFTNVDVIGTYVDMGLTEDDKYMWYETSVATDEFAVAVESVKASLVDKASDVDKLTTKFDSEIQAYMNILQNAMLGLQG